MTSGGAAVGDAFADLQRPDGSGLPFSVYSGSGPAWCNLSPTASTPWVRFTLAASQTSVRTIGVFPLSVYHP